jgi:hypothetical protein
MSFVHTKHSLVSSEWDVNVKFVSFLENILKILNKNVLKILNENKEMTSLRVLRAPRHSARKHSV